MFVLIPHIIRGPDRPHGNADMLDMGTANAIELRRSNSKPAVPAASARRTGRACSRSSAADDQAPHANPAGRVVPDLAPQAQVPQNQFRKPAARRHGNVPV